MRNVLPPARSVRVEKAMTLSVARQRLDRFDLGSEQRPEDQPRTVVDHRARRFCRPTGAPAGVARDQCQPIVRCFEQGQLCRVEQRLAELSICTRQRNEQCHLGGPCLRRGCRQRPCRRRRRDAPIRRLPGGERRRYHRRRATGKRDQREDKR